MPDNNFPRRESLKLTNSVKIHNKIRSESLQLTKSEQIHNKIKLKSLEPEHNHVRIPSTDKIRKNPEQILNKPDESPLS